MQAVRNGAVTSATNAIESSPGIEKSTTVVDRKNALHLACEEGHIVVLNAVLEVLTCQESVRESVTDTESIHSILNAQVWRSQIYACHPCVRLPYVIHGAMQTCPPVPCMQRIGYQ